MAVTGSMKPRDRVFAALSGKPVDRPPMVTPTSVFTIEMMDLVDAPFPMACRIPELNARLGATGFTELGFDTTYHHATVVQESSALGCEVQWEGKDNWPTVRMSRPIWKGPDDIRIPADFLEHPDVQCILRSTEILKREIGDEAFIIGKVMGPWSLGYHVFGVENVLLMSIDEPEMLLRALHKLKEISVLFAEAQIAAGADGLTYPDHATGDLVSGKTYKRFLLEIHKEMAQRIKAPLFLHICGNTMDRMEYIAQTGMAAYHFDSKNSAEKAVGLVNGRIKLVGNINNPVTLLTKGPEEVRAEVFRALDAGVDMIGPECAVPLTTKLQNLLAIPQAVKEWAARKQTPV